MAGRGGRIEIFIRVLFGYDEDLIVINCNLLKNMLIKLNNKNFVYINIQRESVTKIHAICLRVGGGR